MVHSANLSQFTCALDISAAHSCAQPKEPSVGSFSDMLWVAVSVGHLWQLVDSITAIAVLDDNVALKCLLTAACDELGDYLTGARVLAVHKRGTLPIVEQV